ncbi:hypothetical protein GGR51DRAFT_574701 [Nemania sp. FL0031]|nr:hypothetical protein GGR51DRAFT_574701 [Nemania sp. FL0031]
MASLDPAVQFAQYFKMLPAELRQLIWKEAALTSMENPEVLILVPNSVRMGMYSTEKTSLFPPVNTAFPAVMHVNREARHIAKMSITLADIGPYPWKRCRVPQRPFNPEIDTLYTSRTRDPHLDFRKDELAKVQHLAIDYAPSVQDLVHILTFVLNHMPALRTIRRVLPSGLQELSYSDPPCLPHRRCVLRPIWTEVGARMRGSKRGPKRQRTTADGDAATNNNPTIIQPLLQGPIPQQPLGLINYVQASQPRYVVPADIPNPVHLLEEFVRSEAAKKKIVIEMCLITEYCYSTFGDSRFVAVGEKFPNSPNPSTFAALNAHKYSKDLINAGAMFDHFVSRKRKRDSRKILRALDMIMNPLS